MHEHAWIANEIRSFARAVKHRQPELPFPQKRLDRTDTRRPIPTDRANQDDTRLDESLPPQRRETWLLPFELAPAHHASLGHRSRLYPSVDRGSDFSPAHTLLSAPEAAALPSVAAVASDRRALPIDA